MANQWLRLWHDMPTDPKWRTIARVSGQPISLVQAIYLHLLVDASRAVTRGHATVTTEDLASALDVDDAQIDAVLRAMQGRVLDGMAIAGWDKRQPKREDAGDGQTGAKSAAQRKREQRERERAAAESDTGHDKSRDVTPDKDKEEDKDKSKELSPQPPIGGVTPPSAEGVTPSGAKPVKPDALEGFAEFWMRYPKKKSKVDAEKAWSKLKPSQDLRVTMLAALDKHVRSHEWRKDAGHFIPHPATWLNKRRWEDQVGTELFDNHHGFTGQRDYTAGLEANADGSFKI
ncbi:hypothetical protein LJR232_005003 [Aquipseudomonas alcaligenes]